MSISNAGRARKRLSLFAGASLAVVSIVGMAGPTGALAADECGPSTGTQTCTGTFAAITYPATTGNLTLTLANGAATTTGGISVTAPGTNTVTINRSDATAGAGDPSIVSTGGAAIAVTTGTGAISVNLTDGDTGDTPIVVTGTSRGVQLQTASTTAAALTLTTTNGSITATAAGGIGVEATGTSVGAGAVALNLGGAVSGATGVKATSSGTGLLSVTLTAASATVGGDIVGTNGPAIQLTPGANGTVGVQAGRLVRASNAGGAVIEFTNINATRNATVTVNSGTIRSNDATAAGYDDLAVLVAGGAGNSSVNFNNGGQISGRFSLLNTGNASINVRRSGVWHTAGTTTIGLGAGIGALTTEIDALIGISAGGGVTSLAFGDGADVFNSVGATIILGEGAEGATTLSITGLETWTNSSQLRFGDNNQPGGEESDGVGNDRIASSGAATLFTGTTSGAGGGGQDYRISRMIMDADFGASQLDCSAAITADCLDLRGGSTAGVTSIFLNVVGVGGGGERIVLVDVAGAGTSGAGHFFLDASTPGWRNVGGAGGVLDGGLFLYGLHYDAAAKQHVLIPDAPDLEGLELGLFGRAAAVAWDTTTGSWLSRQADLRTGLAGREAGGGAWLKIAGNFVEDTATQTYAFGPDTLDFDNSYAQRTSALVGGIDLLNVADDSGVWIVGVTGGQVRSEINFHETTTEVSFEGNSFGAYASFAGQGFFVDAIVNAVKLDVEYAAPTAGIAGVQSEVDSLGYQVEGGYRMDLNDGAAHLEPLAVLSYVKSDLGDLGFGNVDVAYDETTSLRGALGLRLAGDLAMEALTAQFSLTGRVWQEFEGENTAAIAIPGGGFALLDDTAATVGDVGVALSLFAGERFSANLGYGIRFKRDYQSTDASLSFRLAW